MNFRRFNLTASVAAIGLFLGSVNAAMGEAVTLRANDGSVSLQGDLIDFSDGFYQIKTDLGVLRLSAERVTCEGAGCPQLEQVAADLVFAGSNTMGQGIMPLLFAGYASELEAEADVRNGPAEGSSVVELIADGGFGNVIGTYLVESTTSDDAFDALLKKRAHVGLSARRIRPTEARALRADGAGNMVDVRQERIVAIDPLTVIVHPSNPIETIRDADLAAIFRGEIQNWSQIGGPDLPIDVFSREAGSATRDFFDEQILAGAALTSAASIVADNNQMAAAVNADPGAIGFVGFAFQRGAKPLALQLSCGILATPSAFASKTEEYPLDRRLYMYAREDSLTEDTERFLNFAISANADGAIAKAGFVDLGIIRLDGPMLEAKAEALVASAADNYERAFVQTLVSERAKWDRLSSTFRFSTGSSRLDVRGRADLLRLADYLAEQPAGIEVAMVGFTDSDGAFEGNMRLALNRARQVVDELAEVGGSRLAKVKVEAQGYGPLAPAACNDSKEGKRINRRVEVWIRSGSAKTES